VGRKTLTQSINQSLLSFQLALLLQQGVALTGRNHTVPPCGVGRLTGHAPGPAAADRPRALQTTKDDAEQQRAKNQYWPIRRTSNKYQVTR